MTANGSWEGLMSAYSTLMKEFAAEDIWDGLSMREYDVLYTLSKCPEPTRVGDLHKHVLLSQPALSRLVERLVERGLIARCADPLDGRGVRVSLTEAGRETQRRIGGRHARSVARAVNAALTPDEIRLLGELTWKLSNHGTGSRHRGNE